MVRPNAPTHEADRNAGEHNERVTEDGLTGEGREDVGHQSERRQDHQVHLGVTKDPEQVLPQKRIGALRHVEEVGLETTVEHQQYLS
ncbi:unannotated protein [freshwater metagenome]|uniref:Unannotated protein n=1 Tax=freshwater metagenome TaxID=449393 RepID=A0A6J7LH84_9ZZZZ